MMSGAESSARIVPCFTARSTTWDVDDFLDAVAGTIRVLGIEARKRRKEE